MLPNKMLNIKNFVFSLLLVTELWDDAGEEEQQTEGGHSEYLRRLHDGQDTNTSRQEDL